MAASHVNVYTPLPSERLLTKFPCSKLTPPLKTRKGFPGIVKAVAEKRNNLDHLHRAATQQQSQQKKAPQVAPPTGLWDRFPTARTVQQMMDTMESMMGDPFAYNSTWTTAPLSGKDGYGKGRTPWAIKEGEKDYKMRFDMPGMTKDDVKVWVEEKMLALNAEKFPRQAQDTGVNVPVGIGEEDWPTKSYGKYSCRIALPENIEYDRIKAEVKDGVLYVTVPKASISSKVVEIDVQ